MKGIFVLITTLALSFGAFAPIQNHVKWSYGVKRTGATEAVIFFRAKIDDGWHIYSQHIEDGGPPKTQFAFGQSIDYKLIGKTIEPNVPAKFDRFLKMNIASFEKEVIFQQRVRIKAVNKPIVVNVALRYGACNEKSCSPPDEANFSVAVPLK